MGLEPGEWRGDVSEDVRRRLLANRVVLLHGTMDDSLVAQTSAVLMMLDGAGDERIVVRITGADGPIEQGLVLMDVVAVLGVPVDTVGAGTIAGGAVGFFAAGRHRSLAPHARLHLHEPDASVSGRATDIERSLAASAVQRDAFFERIAALTGRAVTAVAEDWRAARYLEPPDAVSLGYADALEGATPPCAGDVHGA